MAMLLHQIRRSTLSRVGTSALSPPRVFSRFCSGMVEPEDDTFVGGTLKIGFTVAFMFGFTNWVDYGGRNAERAACKKIEMEIKREMEEYEELVKLPEKRSLHGKVLEK